MRIKSVTCWGRGVKCVTLPCVTFALFVGLWLMITVHFFPSIMSRRGVLSMTQPKAAEQPEMEQGSVDTQLYMQDGHTADRQSEQGARTPAAQSRAPGPLNSTRARAGHGPQPPKEREFLQRRQQYEQACRGHGVKGGLGDPFIYPPAKLAVCMTPKVGCSYWLRIFYFLYNETAGVAVASPFEIDRYFIHFGASKKGKTASYRTDKARLDGFTKVMFTRDPWARLWSAYVDKMVLPDSWLDHGRNILRRFKMANRSCADAITFQQFLDYTMSNGDPHWNPVHRVCNPCIFHPTYVGKVETFTKDSQHILRTVGLEKLVEGHDTQRNYSQDEISMLTRYHFQIYAARPGVRKCLRHSGVAHRLWKAFVLNGYIGESLTFPAQEFSKALDGMKNHMEAARVATQLLLKYHWALPALSSQQMRQHRRNIMVQEYRKAPQALLEKVVTRFKDDFALFGYEPRPSDIFQKP